MLSLNLILGLIVAILFISFFKKLGFSFVIGGTNFIGSALYSLFYLKKKMGINMGKIASNYLHK